MRATWEVARWEFLRYLKLRDIVLSFAMVVAIGLGFDLFKSFAERVSPDIAVAVVGGERMALPLREESKVKLQPAAGRDEAALRQLVMDKKLDGVLILDTADSARVISRSRAGWVGELREALTAARRQERLQASGISPQQLAQISAPVRFDWLPANPKRDTNKSGAALAGILIGLMLMSVFVGNAYLFAGITGEKQQRVTEQVIAAISPQAWIDGKILGIAGFSLLYMVVYVVAGFLAVLTPALLGRSVELPVQATNPVLFLQFVTLSFLGLLFWFAFFGAVAATIDDPHTSQRGVFLFFPMLPMITAFYGLKDPDMPLMKVLGALPVSSPAVLSMRLTTSEVAWWEFPLAVVLLVAGIWVLRLAAGKIFAVATLMYGKEPTWREVWRWVRAA
ncbi:MAG: ABC transporter permease [Bryobacteraceae bacterium]|nr:ABC transporter permease [Bryobacteraceae bacterium]